MRMSRFQVHDELTAPAASVPVLTGAAKASGGRLPNFLAVLAGSPAALRAYARFSSELRGGRLSAATTERIGLAVAQHYASEPGLVLHQRRARKLHLGGDELARALRWDSADEREAALLRYLRSAIEQRGHVPIHLLEEAREAGWEDDELLEAIARVALEGFTAMVNEAGDIPVDGSNEQGNSLRAA